MFAHRLLCLILTGLLFFSIKVQDVRGEAPAQVDQVGEEGFQILKQIYDYDATIPLEARIVEKVPKDQLEREKVVFRGVNGFLVPGYFQLPPQRTGPVPCVLLLHGWSGSKEHWWTDHNYISGGLVRKALLEAGFAVFALDAQCHGDRISVNDFAPVNHYREESLGVVQRKGYLTLREIYIQTTRDYRRALDYLQTRTEIDSQRIGVFGYSMGGAQAYLLTGVEPRIRATVSCCAPRDEQRYSPVAPQNFFPGLGDRPFLTVMGRSDPLCPVQHAQAMHERNPSSRKEFLLLDAEHKFPPEYVAPAVAWLRRALSND